MVPGHPNYTPFDADNLYAEDNRGDVRNKCVNRATAFILYKCTFGDPHSCLHWLMPASSNPSDIADCFSRTIPWNAGDRTKKIPLWSPELLAIIATYVQLAPWPQLKYMDSGKAPPFADYYESHYAYFRAHGRDFCLERVKACMLEFFQQFPHVLENRPNTPGGRRASSLLDDEDPASAAVGENPPA